MAESVAPEFTRFVAAERRAARLAKFPPPSKEGEVFQRVFIDARRVNALARVAARRAAGLVRPSKHTEVVWVEGENELAVGFARLTLELDAGLVSFALPVRSDQTGKAVVRVLFAVGSKDAPAGLYAAASRRPEGPPVVVDAWGDALVAFAWHCLLDLVTGIAGATGKDKRGNVLVPVELSVSKRGIDVVPMARHRFAGSSSLERRK
jgi:hypothetical protein